VELSNVPTDVSTGQMTLILCLHSALVEGSNILGCVAGFVVRDAFSKLGELLTRGEPCN
jgi:hypothetical protein